jgi:inorganic pyrophosphatase
MPKLRRRYARITEYSQMPEITIRQIRRFFEHDKDLEPGKWVKSDPLGRRRRGAPTDRGRDRARNRKKRMKFTVRRQSVPLNH